MWSYVAKRLLLGAVTVLLITFFVYALIYPSIHEEVAGLLRGARGDPGQMQAIRDHYQIDKPFLVQYFDFVTGILRPFWTWIGWPPHVPQAPSLGYSFLSREEVSTLILQRLGPTMLLMGSAYLLTLLIAIPIGIISSVRQYSKLDNVVTSLSFIGISLPSFWFGELLIFAFAIYPNQHFGFKVFPPAGMQDDNVEGPLFLNIGWHLVLPMIVLAVQFIAVYGRYMRSAMLDVLSQDYIRTARAKGLAGTRVVVRHALRNALLPLITLIGIDVPLLFVGAIITENVFSWPGMGQLFVSSAIGDPPDHAILLGITVFLSIFVVLGNIAADLAYTWADPRITYSSSA